MQDLTLIISVRTGQLKRVHNRNIKSKRATRQRKAAFPKQPTLYIKNSPQFINKNKSPPYNMCYGGDFLRHIRFRNARRSIFRLIVLLIIIITAGAAFLELRLRPVIGCISSLQAKSLATTEIAETVTDILQSSGIGAEELETVQTDSSGAICAITTNAAEANRLKNLITVQVQENLSKIRNRRVDVPLGTILGSNLLSGTGPGVPVYISLSGTVETNFSAVLESGGINQTVHRLSVEITADINVVTPLYSCKESVSTSVLVGETLIVGKTPALYSSSQ